LKAEINITNAAVVTAIPTIEIAVIKLIAFLFFQENKYRLAIKNGTFVPNYFFNKLFISSA
jgi:hypothetical protein